MSVLSGVFIGWNRRCRGAGVRDFSLIIISVALLTFTLGEIFPAQGAYEGLTNLIIAMGFIAAGIMFNQQQRIVGITTGLAIFTGAVIGVLFGLQQYIYGIVVVILTTITLMLNRFHKVCE